MTDGTQAWYQTTGSGSLPSFTGDTVYMHGDSYANSNTHDWQVYYDWAWDDENGRYNVTATSVCLVGQETFTVTEAAVRVDHRDTTCVLKGYDRYLASFEGCEEYGMSQIFRTDYSDALGHDFVETVIEPDCTNRGYTIHKCSRCREVYNDTYVDALGHDFGEWTVTTEPGCTSKGEETRYCSRCDATETREAEALGHDLEHVEAKAATETECGNIEYWHCTVCGKYFSDENGRNEITEEETVIPKISQIVVGDVNGDGLITIRDLSDMKRLIAGAGDESEFVLANCDINGDGLLTIQDIAELKKLLA